MRTIPSFFPLIIACITCFAAQIYAQSEGEVAIPSLKGQTPPNLQPAFADEFREDTRGDYRIQGDVRWAKGHLGLARGSQILREVEGGGWVKTEIETDFGDPDRLPEPGVGFSVLHFFQDGESALGVELRRHKPDEQGNRGLLLLREITTEEGKPQVKVINGVRLRDEEVDRLEIEYRFGFVRIRVDGELILTGYSDPLEVRGQRIGAVKLSVRPDASADIKIDRWSAAATPAPRRLNESERAEFRAYLDQTLHRRDLMRAGKFREAISVGQKCLETKIKLHGVYEPFLAFDATALGLAHHNLGEYDECEKYYQFATDIISKVKGEHPELIATLDQRAFFYNTRGDDAGALSLRHRISELNASLYGKDHWEYGASLNNLGHVYLGMFDFAKAKRILLQAETILHKTTGGQHPVYPHVLINLSNIHLVSEEHAEAERILQKAVRLIRTIQGEESRDYAAALKNLGIVYIRTQQYEQAKSILTDAEAIARKVLPPREHAVFLETLGWLYFINNDWEAIPLLQEALEILGPTFEQATGREHPKANSPRSLLAHALRGRGQHAKAESVYAVVEKSQRQRLEENSLVQSERQQKQNQALRVGWQHYVANAVEGGLPCEPVLEMVWRWKGAVTLRQSSYRRLASNPDLAPLFASLKKTSQQLSTLTANFPQPDAHLPDENAQLVNQEKRRAWKLRFDRLTEQREKIEQEISKASTEFRLLQAPLTVANIQGVIPDGTALVDFVEYYDFAAKPFPYRFVVFVVRNDRSPVMLDLGAAKTISDLIERFRRPLAKGRTNAPDRQQASDSASELRERLWNPIEQQLDGIDTVLISPDTSLGMLPFAALPGREPATYLLEDYRLARLPFANLLTRLTERSDDTAGQQGLLVLGDVDYDHKPIHTPIDGAEANTGSESAEAVRLRGATSHHWESLSGFQSELTAVRDLHRKRFGEDLPVTVLSRAEASEQRFLAESPKHQILHVITHGYFEDAGVKSINRIKLSPEDMILGDGGASRFVNAWMPGLLSGVVMAGANVPLDSNDASSDGILRASEIEGASLKGVDLVVLSACETGLGEVAAGEGLTGLQRAFQMAGARSVIASLWKVDDDATLTLMTEFYRNLWQKKMSKVDALRQAQLTMLRNYDPKSGKLRGLVPKSVKVDTSKPLPRASSQPARLDPRYWSAFQLSGDWR